MAKINLQALEEVQAALKRYETVVETSGLAEATKKTYLQHAASFVRWLNDEFEPGAQGT